MSETQRMDGWLGRNYPDHFADPENPTIREIRSLPPLKDLKPFPDVPGEPEPIYDSVSTPSSSPHLRPMPEGQEAAELIMRAEAFLERISRQA